MKLTLEWEYKPAKSKETVRFVSDPVTVERAVQLAADIEKTGRVGNMSFMDESGIYWSRKELQKMVAVILTEPTDIVAYFDGGFQKDIQESGQGVAIYYTQSHKHYRVRTNAAFDEISSNSESEYAALWLLVNELDALGVHHTSVTIKGDSMGVIHQMSGEWPCYEENLQRWMDRIEEKMKKLGLQPVYELLNRNDNKEADTLATQALNGNIIHGKKEIID
ncbi:reverse transcriptase-like protein [Fictibacillus enclensis]|uniref:reverse transcriptase-like protein n=1 Tax=Fictibacillus enclensis TaxID=1017270 RepID=UPI0025A2C102|nr:reverse transcriptase-like protein [Fictibacillus enclensis]MDM5338271.1 reverse transcriptase-like protein [Fictibacillus enclensis]